jgi:hypothetical protein
MEQTAHNEKDFGVGKMRCISQCPALLCAAGANAVVASGKWINRSKGIVFSLLVKTFVDFLIKNF